MKYICPQCGHKTDYMAAVKDDALLKIIRMQGEFAPHSSLAMEYAELFGTIGATIKAAKLLRILTELATLFRTGGFTVNRRAYRISRAGIGSAMKQVCNRSFPEPLTNHNYLKKVMTTIAEKESIEAEKALKKREKALRQGSGRPSTGSLRQGSGPVKIGEVAGKLPWK